MIILSSTTDTLEAVLAGAVTANELPIMVSYRDITATDYTPDRQLTNTNGAITVTICSAPAASTQRVVDVVSILNRDTVNAQVTIKYDANGTDFFLHQATLAPGEILTYQDGVGWQVYASTGAVKTSVNQGANATSSSLQTTVLGSDQINNNAVANTIQDVTGLSFAVTAGNTYWFRFVIQYTAAATTTGSRWTINGPAITELRYMSVYSLTTTTQTTNHGLSAYDVPAASNATSASTGSNIAIVEGIIKPSANGTVIARFASEVLSSAITAKAGSVVYFQQIA